MSAEAQLDQSTAGLLEDFFRRHDIRSIRVGKGSDIRDDEVCDVGITFLEDPDDSSGGYVVNFKLLDQASDAHRFLKAIGPRPEFEIELTGTGSGLGAEALSATVKSFIGAISSRVAKIHKEQSILATRPVGKTYLLHGRTRFKVLADDGNGQLTIRIIRKDGSSEAGLAANDLLDGLYSGVIRQV